MKKYITFSILFFLEYGCCKNEPVDPCMDKTEVKAKFSSYNIKSNLEDWMRPYWIHYDYTTQSTAGATWTIDSGVEWDSLEWHIGSEIIYNEPTLFRRNFPENSDIPVTLIVKKTPNKSCFPKDDGRDTLTKIYHFVDGIKYKVLMGKYKGAFIDVKGYTDSFVFNIVELPNRMLYIDTFPFILCPYQIQTVGINYQFEANFITSGCQKDTSKIISSYYFRKIDNTSNNNANQE